MRKLALLFSSVALIVGWGATPSLALTDNVAYVDPEQGTDASNTTCGQTDLGASDGPCATLNQALQNLPASGGTVVIEKGGVFGPIYLTVPVNIIGTEARSVFIDWQSGAMPGCVHGLPGSCNGNQVATYAVDIQANGATDSVKLKNLIINNNGGSSGALHVHSVFSLALNDITLRGGAGSATAPQMMLVDSSQGSQLQIYIHNTDVGFLKNGGGIAVIPTGATPVRMNFNNSEVHNATFGLQANATGLTGNGNIQILVDGTQFFSFNNSAISVNANSPGPNSPNGAAVSLTRSAIVNSGGAGLKATGSGAGGILYESAIIGNGGGVNVVNGAGVFTYSNNEIVFNGVNCEVNGVATACTSALTAQQPF